MLLSSVLQVNHFKDSSDHFLTSSISLHIVINMGNKYRIIINNRAAKFQRFLLFNEAPQTGTQTSKAQAFTNVWAVAPGVPGPHGKTDFKVDVQEWAVSGTSQQALNEKVVVETTDAAPVDLNIGPTTGTKVFMTVMEGGAGFDPSKTANSNVPGGFSIQTGSYDGPDNCMCISFLVSCGSWIPPIQNLNFLAPANRC